MRWMLRVSMLFLVLGTAHSLSAAQDGWKSLFDGKTLDGWDGNPKFWSIQDGAITGQTTKDNPTRGNTFIIWRKGEPADFELKAEYRIFGGNSGIQYRSFETKAKWVIGGYQADMDAGRTWAGTNYGEKYRGVLSKRGEKSEIDENGKRKVVGKVGDAKELRSKIKHEDWNEYHIIARGNHLVQKINGLVMSELIDNDKKARASGLLALQLHAGPPMKIQFRNIRLKRIAGGGEKGATGGATKKVVFVAGRRSHGNGSHEHRAGCMLLAKRIGALPGYNAVVVTEGWPQDEGVFDGASAVIFYTDGGGRHYVNKHLDSFDVVMKKGVGLGTVHYGVEVPKGASGDKLLEWTGGYFEAHWSVNPHWTASFEKFPDHAVARGLKPFKINDEWYYHMRFREGMKGVTPILTAMPGPETLRRKNGAHSGNPHVRAAVLERKEQQHVAWVATRSGGGRGFGFTGGHFHRNWKNDNFRRMVLNAVVWIARGEVPAGGVASGTPDDKEMQANQDKHGKLDSRIFSYP